MKTYGTFTKDDQTVTAETPAEAVSFEFAGWKRVDEKPTTPPKTSDKAGS